MNIQEFADSVSKRQVHIYGAGNLGNLLFWYLKGCGIDVASYIVSEYHSDGYYVTNGLPISGRDEFLKHINKEENVIVAIKFQEQIADELREAGISQTYCLVADDELIMAKALFDQMLPGIRTEENNSDMVDILGQRFKNPFTNDERFLDFFMGGVDMLFPWLCKEERWINEGPYELGNVQLNAGDVIINCGASVGMFSQIALNRGCEVHAFEPAQKQLGLLKESLALYDKSKWNIVEKALSSSSGMHDFYIHKCFEYDGFYEKSGCISKISVPTITIDDYVEENRLERIDFIKANIEGAERDMLTGAVKTLRDYAPKLSIRANHLPDDVEVITDIIRKANPDYKIVHKYKNIYACV